MGGNNTKPLLFGTFKISGEQLYKEGIIINEPGELPIGMSKELIFKVTSKDEGNFHVIAKYLGGVIKEVDFNHEDLIILLHESETSEVYQRLSTKLSFRRQGKAIQMGRAFSLDVTKLVPYLYERFSKQNLSDKGEKLVQECQLARLGKDKRSASTQDDVGDQEVNNHVRELEALERQLRASVKG
eukprot:m.343951 g.343951  ORF g.343951 m.343951 type:complete len:185 (-) comp23605_c0_seq1:281-835(-)